VAGAEDAAIERLARLFREHPAWVEAARLLAPEATSSVYFRHRPREPWRLEHRQGQTRLLPGASPDPDLVFRFTPASIERLAAARGGIGDFALELFALALEQDPEARVEIRVAAPFSRLLRRGYVRLLLAAGPRLAALGASHGVRTPGALRRLVAQLRSRGPEEWEEG
jgi:hypothetical protein